MDVRDAMRTVPIRTRAHMPCAACRDLNTNSLSGTIPSELGSLTWLHELDLDTNSLTGRIPDRLGNLTQLQQLALHANSVTGTIPSELASLAQVTYLLLHDNSLTGSIPQGLGDLRQLVLLDLSSNALTSTVPDLSGAEMLGALVLHNNELSGPLPGLPKSVQTLYLHSNSMSGKLPSLAEHGKVRQLTLFNNDFEGKLVLPSNNAEPITILYVHNNRLSCKIGTHNTTFNATDPNQLPVVLPGNMFSFSGDLPPWITMRGSRLLYAEPSWRYWRDSLVEAGAGLLALMVGVLVVTRCQWQGFFRFRASTVPYVLLEVRAAWMMVLASVIFMSILLPTFLSGANFYECGRPWLHTTITYLHDAAAEEWVTAVCFCGFAAAATIGILFLRKWLDEHDDAINIAENRAVLDATNRFGEALMPEEPGSEEVMPVEPVVDEAVKVDAAKNPPEQPASWLWTTTVILGWMVLLLVLCLPSGIYAVSASLPGGDNTLGLSSTWLEFDEAAIYAVVYVVSSYIVPLTARRAATCIGRRHWAPALMVGARLMLYTLVPFVVVLVTHQNCHQMWLTLWKPCQSAAAFDITAGVYHQKASHHGNRTFYDITFATPVLQHIDICQPSYVNSGSKCPRAVIEVVGNLLVGKMAFNALAGPAITLAMYTYGRRVAERVHACLGAQLAYCCLDKEVASVVMLLDIVLVMGFNAPWLLPLAAASLYLHACVFRWSVEHCQIRVAGDARCVRYAFHVHWLLFPPKCYYYSCLCGACFCFPSLCACFV